MFSKLVTASQSSACFLQRYYLELNNLIDERTYDCSRNAILVAEVPAVPVLQLFRKQ